MNRVDNKLCYLYIMLMLIFVKQHGMQPEEHTAQEKGFVLKKKRENSKYGMY